MLVIFIYIALTLLFWYITSDFIFISILQVSSNLFAYFFFISKYLCFCNSCFIGYIIIKIGVSFGSMLGHSEKKRKREERKRNKQRRNTIYVHDINSIWQKTKDKRHIVISINYFDFKTNSQNANASKCHLKSIVLETICFALLLFFVHNLFHLSIHS